MKNSIREIQEKRDLIIYGKKDYDNYTSFHDLSFSKLNQLVSEKLINLDEQQNDAPTIEEIYDFMKKYPSFTCHGYVIRNRPDHRVSLEGVNYRGIPTIEMISDFADLFRHADDFMIQEENLYCWFD